MRFGVSSASIVPPFKTRMYGYWNRFDPFDDVHGELTVTAVYLEAKGSRALLCAADIGMFPSEGLTEKLIDRLARAADCPAEHVLLNASHTHGGSAIPTHMPAGRAIESTESAYRFVELLGDRLEEATLAARAHAEEGTLWYGCGKTSIPINRRLEKDGRVILAPNPAGAIEDRMRLLVLKGVDGQLRSVGLLLSCHPVATGGAHLLTADFPGAWRAAFHAEYGESVTPFFLQGTGGDMRPRATANGDSFRSLQHAELQGMGRQMMEEMDATLQGGLEELDVGPFRAARRVATVPCERRYLTRADFEVLLRGTNEGLREYAGFALERLGREGSVPDHQDFPVTTLWLNEETALIGIPAEVLTGLGRAIEGALAPRRALVMGYTNGNASYLPDTHELARGGFECDAYLHEILTGPYRAGVEDRLVAAIQGT
jgi:neutral ceramidase